jgi:tRNA 2-thiouridine synthesizing protein C
MDSQLLILINANNIEAETSAYVEEAIDAAMGVAAFGVSVSILFSGACINFVVGENRLKIIDGLEFYDVEKLYIFESDLQQTFSSPPALCNNIQILQDNQLNNLLDQHQHVLRMG